MPSVTQCGTDTTQEGNGVHGGQHDQAPYCQAFCQQKIDQTKPQCKKKLRKHCAVYAHEESLGATLSLGLHCNNSMQVQCAALSHVHCMQEGGGWGSDKSPSSSVHPTVRCSANKGGSGADPKLDNPTFQILNSSDFSLSPQLTLTILLQSWPINSYPFLAVLPQGSTLIIAGNQLTLHCFHYCFPC